MTVGALIFAQNNTGVDYIQLAVYAASRVKEFLGIPVTLATDDLQWLESQHKNHGFDQVVKILSAGTSVKSFYDGSISSKYLEWKNATRYQAYDLSPYETTLVIDSDYIINSSLLKPALSRECSFQIYKKSVDLADWRGQHRRINDYSVPFYWATAFIFKKNEVTQAFFDLVSYIKHNWVYFRNLYEIEAPMFRNDYAFSIAIHIMNGKTDGGFAVDLPGTLVYTSDRDLLVKVDNSSMRFLIEKEKHLGEYILSKTTDLDIHVMNKMSLSRFITGGCGV